MPSALVFTDLDGTLLDLHDFSWEAARPGLELLRQRQVPLVFTSSKTRRELEVWRERIGNTDPFISENGGALWIPADWQPRPERATAFERGLFRVEIGAPLAQLRVALREISAELGVALRGFGDMSRDELVESSGLDGEELDNALAREYDEPFLPERNLTGAEKAKLAQLARARWLTISKGGRFYHLTGPTSKKRAAQVLLEAIPGPVAIIALGDAPNDMELLQMARYPVVVAQPDGSHAPELMRALPHATFTKGVGPAGFSEGVRAALGMTSSE